MTTAGGAVVSTTGGTAAEVVPQSVTVTVTVTGPSDRLVSIVSEVSELAQLALTTIELVEEVFVVDHGIANYRSC